MTAEIELARPGAASLPCKIQYTKSLAGAGLLPAQYRGKPAHLFHSVEYGEMPGLAPMATISGVRVIEGRPTGSTALISSLVRRAGHRLRVTGDDQRVVCRNVLAEDDTEYTFRFGGTMDRARASGLINERVIIRAIAQAAIERRAAG
jgi:hypothetical protein